ncbi:hypothetical protein H4R18_002081 [Coemansia javaensis]|uniref:Translation initiation factor 3 N-terminal domain-containing protein n=1 Tax=Coemansia javaensis TaxID=2761396 RepID=A0A9W8HCZ5_9FUNG|nr:hypothetical protein H4R18_002081 [Coemansia javaensis]
MRRTVVLRLQAPLQRIARLHAGRAGAHGGSWPGGFGGLGGGARQGPGEAGPREPAAQATGGSQRPGGRVPAFGSGGSQRPGGRMPDFGRPRDEWAAGAPQEAGARAGFARGKELAQQRIQKQIQRRLEAAQARADGGGGGGAGRALRDEEIQAPVIAVVDESGAALGEQTPQQALSGLDRSQQTLVMVDAGQDPPVCRIFPRRQLYEREKRAKKQAAAQQRTAKTQSIVMRDCVGDHDLEIKCRRLCEMLQKGRRVTVVVERPRRAAGPDRRAALGAAVMARARDLCSVAAGPAVEGAAWSVTLQGRAPDAA